MRHCLVKLINVSVAVLSEAKKKFECSTAQPRALTNAKPRKFDTDRQKKKDLKTEFRLVGSALTM